MQKQLKAISVIALILAYVYFFPRYLIGLLGPADPWTSYFYQYGLGLLTFGIGIAVILKSGACQLGRGRDSFWFGVLLAGFVLYASMHALWIITAQSVPYLGG